MRKNHQTKDYHYSQVGLKGYIAMALLCMAIAATISL